MNIEKTFRYNQKDLVNFGISAMIYKRGRFLFIITSIFIAALILLILINGGLGQTELLLALLYVFVLVATPIVARLQMKKAYNLSQIFREEQEFVLNDKEFYGKSTSGECRIEWDKFHEFIIYKNSIALYISTRQAFILPKNVLTQDEIDDITGFLTTDIRTKGKVKISKYI